MTSLPPKPPAENRKKIIVGSIAGLVLLLILLGNCGGDDRTRSASSTTTVTRTVTSTAAPVTVTYTETATAQAPPPMTVPEAAAPPPPPAFSETNTPLPAIVPLVPQVPASAYYGSCAAARAAGAAPLYAGEPGYRSGLDRDGDGVACE